MTWKMVKPKPMSAIAVRSQAIIVRSSASRVPDPGKMVRNVGLALEALALERLFISGVRRVVTRRALALDVMRES